jgi:hypothetical protein
MTRRRWLLAITAVTLAFSCAVAVSWLGFGRSMAIGHPLSALARPGIYLSQAVMAGIIGLAAVRWLGGAARSSSEIAVLALAAWWTARAARLTPGPP